MGFHNNPDNLRSTDTFEVLLGLTTSRATLAPGGLKNFLVDGVPVEDGQGNASFQDLTISLFDGDPTIVDPVKLVLGQSSGPTTVNLTVGNSYENGQPGDWVNAAITSIGAEFIDLRFVVQQLYSQTKKGIYDNTASLEVEMRASGTSTWVNPMADLTEVSNPSIQKKLFGGRTTYQSNPPWLAQLTSGQWVDPNSPYMRITGKTTSAYVRELRVQVPSTGAYAGKSWQVRVRLIERDYQVSGSDGENEDRRTITWESISPVSTAPLGGTEEWRGLSYAQVFGKATDQINGIPELTGIYDLGRYHVPPSTVWDPEERIFSGEAWDGVTTQVAWTQCPAWQIKGLIEDDLSGISALTPGSTMNKWDALEASKWFSELVPDGKGGMHPRYSANWFIEQGMQAHELINYLAGAVGSFAWDEGNGQWRIKVEKPENPAMIFTKENIVGEFHYQHTDFDSRFNDYIGVFRNRDAFYKEDRVRVHDQPDIDATGRRHTSIVLVGCDNRQEALRRLKLRLLSSLNEYRIVSFTTNRQGNLLEPLSIIGVADGDLLADTSIRSTGRIVGISSDRKSITVRDTLRLELGVGYELLLTVPNPDYTPDTNVQPASPEWRKPTIAITRQVVNTNSQRGDIYTIHLDAPLPESLPEFAPVSLSCPGLPALPKQYRVTNVTPGEDGELVTITAVEVYTPKWVESDAVVEDQILSQQISRFVPPPVEPADGVFKINEYSTQYQDNRVLTVNWGRPASFFFKNYRFMYRFNGGNWITHDNYLENFFEIQNPLEGHYEVQVFARDRRGLESVPLLAETDLDEFFNLRPLYNITGFLTNESHTVPTDNAGANGDYSLATGEFRVFFGDVEITEECVFQEVSKTNCNGNLNIATNQFFTGPKGAYRVTSMSGNTASFRMKATYTTSFGSMSVTKDFTLAKSKAGVVGVDGAPGAAAKTLSISSDRQVLYYDKLGVASPTTQTIALTANKQNTSATVNWTVTDANGVARTPTTSYLSSATGDTVSMTESQFAAARNATSGVIIKATLTDGTTLIDQISVVRVQAGADGAPGAAGHDALVAFLTNEAVTLAAASDGVLAGYGGANGSFKVYSGAADVSSSFQLSTLANPQVLTVAYTGMNYSVSGGFDANEDTASVTIRATGTGTYAGMILDKVFSLAKSKSGTAGNNGADAKTLSVVTDRQVIFYDGAGAASPTNQTINFSTNKQNTSATVNWTLTDANGVARTPVATYLSAATGNSVSMTEAQFALARNGTSGVIVTASLTDGTTISDKISIVRVQAGANGTNGTNGTNGSDGMTVANVIIYKRSVLSPVLPSATTTFTFASGVLTGLDNGWSTSLPSGTQPVWVSSAVAAAAGASDTIANTEWITPVLLVQNGTDGLPGTPAASPYMSNEAQALQAYSDGTVLSFLPATGLFKMMVGNADVTIDAVLSVTTANCTGTVNTAANTPVAGQVKGYYRVTAMSADDASLTITATYNGSTYVKVFSLTKAKAGIESVTTLPTTNLFLDRVVIFNGKIYRYTSTGWDAKTLAADLTGQITETQIATDAITTPKLAAGAVTAGELAANAVESDKIKAGAVLAGHISVTNLSAISATLGTFQSAPSGARTLISGDVIKVFYASGGVAVQIGNLSA